MLEFSFLTEKKRKKLHFPASRNEERRRGKSSGSEERGGSVVTYPDSFSWKINSSAGQTSVKSATHAHTAIKIKAQLRRFCKGNGVQHAVRGAELGRHRVPLGLFDVKSFTASVFQYN